MTKNNAKDFDQRMRNLMYGSVEDEEFDKRMRRLMYGETDEETPEQTGKTTPVTLPEMGGPNPRLNLLNNVSTEDQKPQVAEPVTPPVAEAGVKTPTPEPKPLPKGLITEGNLDLNKRPVVPRDDGKISTVNSITVGFDDGFYVIPTVTEEGLLLDNDQAVEYFKKTGKHLGRFYDQETADAFAQQLHLDQEKMYGGQGEAKYPGLFTELVEKFGNWARENEAATPYVKGQEMGGPNTRVNLLDGIPEEKRDPLWNGVDRYGGEFLASMNSALWNASAGQARVISEVAPDVDYGGILGGIGGVGATARGEAPDTERTNLVKGIDDWVQSSIARFMPRDQTKLDEITQGFGSAAGYYAPGLAFNKLFGAAAAALRSPEAVNMISALTRHGSGLAPSSLYSLQQAQASANALSRATVGISGGVMEGLSEAVGVFDDAIKNGMSKEDAFIASMKNAVMNIPIASIANMAGAFGEHKAFNSALLKMMDKVGLIKRIGLDRAMKAVDFFTRTLSGMASEGTQETIQNLSSEKFSTGNPWSEVLTLENIKEKALGPGGVGSIVGGTLAALLGGGGVNIDSGLAQRLIEKYAENDAEVGGADEVLKHLKSLGIDVNLLDPFSSGQADAAPSQTPPTDGGNGGGGGILETLVNNLKGTNPQMAQDVQDASGMLTPEQASEAAGILREQINNNQNETDVMDQGTVETEAPKQSDNQGATNTTVATEKVVKDLSDAYASGQVNDAQLDEAGGMLDTILGVPFGTTANKVRSGLAAPVAPAPATGEALPGESVQATGAPAKAEKPKLTRAQKIARDLSNVQTRGDALEKVKGLKGKTLTEIANELGVEVSPNDTPATLRNKIIESTASENVGALAKRAQDYIRSRVERGETVVPPSGREAPAPAQTQTVPAQQEVVETPTEEPQVPESVTQEGQETRIVRYSEKGELKEAPVTYDIVEADTLITSKDDGYPQELQPRDTDRSSSEARVGKMAANLKPELLGFDDFADRGAPTTDANGVVVAGNHRTWGIQRAYATKKGHEYKKFLVEKIAKKLGIDPEVVKKMKNPVLRRRIDDPNVNLKAFAQDANISVVGDMSASEQARADADNLTPTMLSMFETNDRGEISSRDFVEAFIRANVRDTELGKFADKNGNLSQDGIRRIKNAIVAKAYGDADLVGRISESTDDNMKRVSTGMMQGAPAIAKMEERISKGLLHPLSIRGDVMKAIEIVNSARSNGRSVSEYLNGQVEMFAESPISDTTRMIAEFFASPRTSAKAVRDFLNGYAQAVERLGSPQEQMIPGLGVEVPSTAELVERVLTMGKDQEAETGNLFDQAEEVEKDEVKKVKDEIRGKTKAEIKAEYGDEIAGAKGLDATAKKIVEKRQTEEKEIPSRFAPVFDGKLDTSDDGTRTGTTPVQSEGMKVGSRTIPVADTTAPAQSVSDSVTIPGEKKAPVKNTVESATQSLSSAKTQEEAESSMSGLNWKQVQKIGKGLGVELAKGQTLGEAKTAVATAALGNNQSGQSQQTETLPVQTVAQPVAQPVAQNVQPAPAPVAQPVAQGQQGKTSPAPAPAQTQTTASSPVVASLNNAQSREEGAEILKGLKKADLLGVAKELGLPVRKSDTVNSLRDAIVEDTVGSRLRSDAFRTSDLRSENEKLGETKEEKTETEKPTPKYRVTEDGRDTSKLTEFEDEVQDQEAKSEPVKEQSKSEPVKEEPKPEPAKENTKTEDGSPSAETVDLNKKITFSTLKKAFPKEKVYNLGNGVFRIVGRNGQTAHLVLAKRVDIDPVAYERENGKPPTQEMLNAGALGSTTLLVDGTSLIQIAADMTMTAENVNERLVSNNAITTRATEMVRTIFHESYHAASDMVLSKKEKAILHERYGNEEAQADAYMDWLLRREIKSTTGRIFQRIFDFFSRVRSSLLGPDSESVFVNINRGNAWSRKANEVASDSGKAGPSYRVKADPAAYEASMADLKNSVSLASVMKTAGSQKWGTNVDFMYALEKEIRPKLEAVGIDYDSTYDKKDTDPAYQKLKAYLVDVATADALEAIQNNENAIGWYDEKTSQALSIMSLVYPELATDQNAKFAFTVALAVTSNGQKVNKNFELAKLAYEEYKRTGKMPTNIGIGTTKGSIDQGLNIFNILVEKYGIDDTRKILTTRFTVGQLKSIGIEVKGELVDQWVIGGATLGPKVGNGFFANLNRFFDALTMDRWFMRSWGRWTGKLFSTDQSKQMGSEARLGRSVSDILSKIEADVKADVESGKFKLSGNTEKARDKSFLEEVRRRSNEFLSSVIGSKRAQSIDLISVKEEIDSNEGKERKYHKTELSHNLAKAIKGASVKKEARNAMRDSYGGDEFRKAGNNLANNIDEEKQAPDNGSERKFIRDVFTDVLANLRDQGYNDLTMADLQAVLWYAERKVYESAKAKEVSESYEDDEAPDYANAAEKLAQSLGVPQEEIARAKEEAKNVNSTADAGQSTGQNDQKDGKGDGRGEGTSQTTPEGFLEGERKKFLKRHIFSKQYLEHVRTQKGKRSGGGRDGDVWIHKRKSDRGDRSLRGLEIQATYTPTATLEKILDLSEISHPTVHELAKSPENAKAFREAITEAKNSDLKYGAAVWLYEQSEYEDMRLFLTDDGKHGFAIKKDGDIVSVFSAKNKDKKKFDAKDRDTWSGVANWFLTVATSEGGTKLDCYDTILPKIYKLNGFREVGRDKWNESLAPTDWNKGTFKDYNNGEPDVVYMEYDPTYDPFAEQGEQSTTKYRVSDREYLSAVEAGDMETAQRMVDEAAEEAGYTYHRYTRGSPSGDIPWMMFAIDKESVENAYGNKHYVASDRDAIDIEDLIPDIAEALEEYGSTEFIRDNAEAIADELNPDEIVTSAGSWDDADVVQDVWDRVLKDRGILKVKTTNGLIVMAEQDSDGNPLVKSADPVVKDDKGNIIPLSERFDSKKPDIRYRVAYHGSPHRFTEFSTEYIGTGERAQAFGWGLYFADKKEVAEYYRTSVTNRQPTDILIDGDSIASLKEKMPSAPFPAMIRAALNNADGDIDRAKEYLLGRKEGNPNLSPNRLKQYDDAINFVESLRGHEIRIERPGPGQIYEVDIPDDNVLLDWDKPLREQPETVRDAVKKALESVPDQDYLRVVTSSYILPSEGYDADKLDGQEIYILLGTVLHGDKEASQLLGSHGIKGIKYLDGNSRWRGEGTHNFVVFDDEAIKVVKTHYRMRPGMVESKTPVTGDDLKRSVPGAKVFDMGKIPVMKLRNGKYLAVDPTGEIPMGMDVSLAEIGEDVNTGSIASNSVMAIDGNHFLTLIDGMTRGNEIPEGLYEIGRSSALSVEQYNKLDQLIGAPAPQAGMYREFLATGKTPNGEITKIFNAIKDFYSTIKTKIFGRRGSAVFDRIGSREGGYQGGTKYRIGGATQSQQWKQAISGLNMEEVVEPTRTSQTLKDKMNAAWRWWKREVTDDISGIRDYFGEDIYIKATNAIHGINSRAEGLIRFGEKSKGVKSLSDIFSRVPENEQDGFMHFVVYTHMLDIARNTENAMAAANQLDVLAKEEMDKARAFLKTVPADQSELTTLRRNARIHEEIADEYRRQAEEARKQIHETRAKADDYQMAVDNLRKAYPHWEQAQRDLTKFNRFLLWKLKKAGIISSSLHDTLVTRYPNYVPLQRDFGEEAGFESFVRTGGIVNLANPLKKLKGSSRDVKDPLLQIISNVYAFEGLLGKQEAGQDIASMADNGQLAGLVDPIAESERTGLPGEYVFHVWENGKKKYYKTDQDIYTALVMSSKDAGTGGFATLLKVLSIPVRVLRAGVTHGVGFILRNPMRDTVNAGMVGDHFTPIMTTLKGAFSILSKKDGWFEEFMKSGASQGVAYLSPKTKAELARSIRMGTGKTRILNELKNPPRALWRLLGEMAQFTELATRVGQYRVSRERGADMGKAAYEARDLLNYQRGGRVSRAISKVNPFFNAQIQGVAKGLRSMYHDGKVDAKSLARGMLYITLPSMLVTLWNYGDDDRRKKYLSIPAWQRNLFWNIVVGEGDDAWILKLPKPFDLGLLFGSIPERAMDYLYADDKKAFDDLGKSVLDAVSPEWGPLFMTLPLELATNYSFFRGGNIVPMSQERLDPRLQYGPYTAEWAKWAGERFGLSPRKLEYVVNNITGNLGKEVADLTDKVFRAMSGETRPAREWYQEVPGVSAFAVPAKAMKRWEQTFRDERDELDTILRSAKEVMETKGRKGLSRDERRALGAENAIKRVNRYFTGKGGINELQREINKITVAKNLSSEEKRRRVDRLQKRIAQITERGLRDTARIKNSLKKP